MNRITLWLNYVRPNIFVRSLMDIDIHMLKISGVKSIVCDLDNTLVPHFSKFPNKYVYDFFTKVKQEGINLVIASNNTKKRVVKFVNKLEEKIKIDGYIWSAHKPFVHKIKKFLKEKNYSFSNTIFIGDQFITDIFLANRLKAKSILVLPTIDPNKQASINIFFQFLEKYIYKQLGHQNILSKNSPINNIDSIEEYELL